MRILFLSSHIGLGHAARDAAIADAVKRFMPSARMYACSGEPASSYLKRRGLEVVSACRNLRSLTPLVELIFNNYFGFLRARSALDILEHNYRVISELLSGGDYDLVLADEFWELVYKASSKPVSKVAFITDFLGFSAPLNPFKRVVVEKINKYIVNRLSLFRRIYYAGEESDVPSGLRYALVKLQARILGGLPSYVLDKPLRVEDVRRQLGVDEDAKIIVLLSGGTAARSRQFIKNALCAIAKSRVANATTFIISGPRSSYVEDKYKDLDIKWVGYIDMVRDYLLAADLVISRAGRTSIADIECAQKPAVIVPIKGHLEQEHLARAASSRNPLIYSISESRLCSKNTTTHIRRVLSKNRTTVVQPCLKPLKAAQAILKDQSGLEH